MTNKKLLRLLNKNIKIGNYYCIYTKLDNRIVFGKVISNAELISTKHISVDLEVCFGWWHLADANEQEIYRINRSSFGSQADFFSTEKDSEYYTLITEISCEEFYKKYQVVKTALSLKKELEQGMLDLIH